MQPPIPPSGEYALRACACLAAAPPGAWVPARDLAAQAHIPPAFSSKVLRRLVTHGLLEGQKGHHGGFRLARPASEIRLEDVLIAAEVLVDPGHCAFGYPRCNSRAPCPLHDSFVRLQQVCQMWARSTTLAELDLSRLPGPDGAPPAGDRGAGGAAGHGGAAQPAAATSRP